MIYGKFSYNDCVVRGKELIETQKQTKYELCLLTIRVCTIQMGGHGPNKNIYSMKRFADDIGMKPNTLRKWMEEHRNVAAKLPQKPKAKDYKIIREVMKSVTSKTPTKEVRKIYNTYKQYSNEDYLLLSQIKNAKAIRNYLKEHDLNSLKKKDFNILKEIIENISGILSKQKVILRKNNKTNTTRV